jgi:hypothetical protein
MHIIIQREDKLFIVLRDVNIGETELITWINNNVYRKIDVKYFLSEDALQEWIDTMLLRNNITNVKLLDKSGSELKTEIGAVTFLNTNTSELLNTQRKFVYFGKDDCPYGLRVDVTGYAGSLTHLQIPVGETSDEGYYKFYYSMPWHIGRLVNHPMGKLAKDGKFDNNYDWINGCIRQLKRTIKKYTKRDEEAQQSFEQSIPTVAPEKIDYFSISNVIRMRELATAKVEEYDVIMDDLTNKLAEAERDSERWKDIVQAMTNLMETFPRKISVDEVAD